ncbi:PaaI family thioesterase [Mycobacterium simiae]|uniref:Acyl-coenzyme A thioesterase THEM4 n=1 Tax=Mycobacterium simiae TaxID=1784 RepID=A0A5B1BLC2_MYCSI|nr:PaaI family thioesterase [Mycobacterium simiae]KAA1249478.1 PaaI family thioesterase [Mycobacterium simiae]
MTHYASLGSEGDPAAEDPDYQHHGGFPEYGPAHPGPGFGRFVATMRRLQDLAVSADPSDRVWDEAAERAAALVDFLGPFQAEEGKAPAGRSPDLPGMGSLLLPPWTVTRYAPDGVEMRGSFSRFHVGGNSAVHGGVLPLAFDHMFGMVSHAAARPISRTAFLHVDYRKITPIDASLVMRGRVTHIDGRKAFVSAELVDSAETVLAEANGLMVRLLPGQP